MKLIDFTDYQVKVNGEALLVKPIRDIYNKDKSKNHESFMQQMSYLYFMVDPRSTYNYITEDEERSKTIILQEGLPSDFTPSEDLTKAMEWYEKHTVTPSQKLLKAALTAADTVSQFLMRTDILEQLDDKGRPMYDVAKITNSLSNVNKLVPQLQELQRKVEQEIDDKGRARGTDKKMFEDGFEFNNR